MSKTLRIATGGLLVLGLVGALPLLAQEEGDDIRTEIEALKQGQRNIQKQLNEIKRMLQRQRQQPARQGPQVKDVVFDLGANEVMGEKDARLTLIEFTDYQ